MAALSPQNQAWVNAAAKGTGLPPQVVAAQINQESGFNDRATSPTGAQGRAQFEPGTWASLGIQGSPYQPGPALQGYIKYMGGLLHQFGGNVRNALAAYNAGPGNIQAGMGYAHSILSAAGQAGGGTTLPASGSSPTGTAATFSVPVTTQQFDQAGYSADKAKYIAGLAVKASEGSTNPFGDVPGASKGFAQALGPDSAGLFAKGLLTSSAPNPQNYVSTKTHNEQIAVGQLQKLSGMPLVNTHQGAAGDVNPIPSAVIGRTDMGVDANLKPGSPILSPNQARVVAITPNWYKGQPYIAIQLTAGPNRGKVMYVAEQVAPSVQVGQTLRRGQPIGTYAQQGTGIEIGWASPGNPTQTLAQATTGYGEGQQTQAGSNFRSYLGSF